MRFTPVRALPKRSLMDRALHSLHDAAMRAGCHKKAERAWWVGLPNRPSGRILRSLRRDCSTKVNQRLSETNVSQRWRMHTERNWGKVSFSPTYICFYCWNTAPKIVFINFHIFAIFFDLGLPPLSMLRKHMYAFADQKRPLTESLEYTNFYILHCSNFQYFFWKNIGFFIYVKYTNLYIFVTLFFQKNRSTNSYRPPLFWKTGKK